MDPRKWIEEMDRGNGSEEMDRGNGSEEMDRGNVSEEMDRGNGSRKWIHIIMFWIRNTDKPLINTCHICARLNSNPSKPWRKCILIF